MVKIGDIIEVNGKQGEITDIRKLQDGRYLICIKNKERECCFIEGDKDFKLIKDK